MNKKLPKPPEPRYEKSECNSIEFILLIGVMSILPILIIVLKFTVG